MSFIDDYSKFTWIYLLKYKYEVFHKFTEFQSLVERIFNRKIIAMQTDWGGEYQTLHAFFLKVGIMHHVSCPHAHQQNGAAERKHRHIVEVGLSLLAHASMPLKFWDEAFITATNLINRLPLKSSTKRLLLSASTTKNPTTVFYAHLDVRVGQTYGPITPGSFNPFHTVRVPLLQ